MQGFKVDFKMRRIGNGKVNHFDKVGVDNIRYNLEVDNVSYIRDTNKVLDLHEKALTTFLYVQAIKEAIKIDFKKGNCIGV